MRQKRNDQGGDHIARMRIYVMGRHCKNVDSLSELIKKVCVAGWPGNCAKACETPVAKNAELANECLRIYVGLIVSKTCRQVSGWRLFAFSTYHDHVVRKDVRRQGARRLQEIDQLKRTV